LGYWDSKKRGKYGKTKEGKNGQVPHTFGKTRGKGAARAIEGWVIEEE